MAPVLRRVLTLPIQPLVALPIVRRVGFHARRIGAGLDLHFFRRLLLVLAGFVLLASFAVTVLEPQKRSMSGLGDSFYWAVTTVIGSGDASYVTSAGGFVIGWLLAFFGVAIVAALTATFVGFVTDIVSGGTGSELYRVALPDEYCDLTPDELSSRLRAEHSATLLAVVRDGTSISNPPVGFRLQPGDDAIVVAESLGTLSPLDNEDALRREPRTRSVAEALKDAVTPPAAATGEGAAALGS